MIDARQLTKVQQLTTEAVAAGARIMTTRSSPNTTIGHFVAPTLLTHIPAALALVHEEIFGPIAPVIPFENEPEVINLANATQHGLAAYIFTQDIDRAFRTADALEAGMVGINRGMISNAAAPFGGTKQSGLGREGGHEGVEAFTETKYISLAA